MVGPIRIDGLSSGIDYTSIIEKLLSLQRKPIETYEAQITKAGDAKTSLLQVNANLLSLQGVVNNLAKPSFFNRTKAVSSQPTVLAASGTQIATTGAFNFVVKRLAQSHQLLSNGFASTTSSVTASDATLRIELGGGFLDRRTPVALLNGQTGIDRGSIQVADSAGNVAVINLDHVLTVQDVLDAVNASTQVMVEASVRGDQIVIRDTAGGAGTLAVSNFGGDATASSLGLNVTSQTVGGSQFIFGNDVLTVNAQTSLTLLNDSFGVRRNTDGTNDFTITDTGGVAFGVDVRESDTTVQAALDRINAAATAAGSSLTASLSSEARALVLADTAGAAGISVATASDSFAAVDLGLGRIVGGAFTQVGPEDAMTGLPSATGNRLVGTRLVPTLNSTHRNLLNGGQTNTVASDLKGIADGAATFTDRAGVSATLDLSSRVSTTVASSTTTSILVASTAGFAVGNRIRYQSSSGIQERTVVEITGANLLLDKPIVGTVTVGEGVFAVTETTQDLLRLMNDRLSADGVGITVSLNPETNGLLVSDTTGGSGTLSVSGAPATDLGIAGSVSADSINGSDLDAQSLGEGTLLASMNAGEGVQAGKFRVLDTNGTSFDVDLTQSDDVDLAEVIQDGNGAAIAAGSGVRFRINDTGDGLLVEDTTPGAGTLVVSELGGGRTARDLNILGSAPSTSPAVLDGSFEFEIAINAGSTLADVQNAINTRGIPVQAGIINDGNPVNPYRLSLLSRRSGEAGRMVVDSNIAGLSFTTTAAAQNSVLLYGSNGGASDPAVISSGSNRADNVVPGLTLELLSASDAPVTVTVSRDTENILTQAQSLADAYNKVVGTIRELTFFDPSTFETGPLFSDATVRRIERELARMVTLPVAQIPSGDPNSLAAIGFSQTSEGGLTLDTSVLSAALADDFDAVVSLFTLQRKLELNTPLSDFNNGLGISVLSGDDFTILARNGTTRFGVDVSATDTVSSLLLKINSDPDNGGILSASISADGFSLRIDDASSISARSAGGPTTATTFFASEADLTGLADDRIVGATVTFTSGANSGEVRTVTAFNTSTEEITLDSALPSASYAGSAYTLQRELEVIRVGDSKAAAELKIEKKTTLGQNVLQGSTLNLQKDPGVAARMSEQLDVFTRSGDGIISTRVEGLDDRIEGLNETIDRIEERVKKAEARLVREFAKLEILLAESRQTILNLQSSLLAFVSTLARPATGRK